MIVLAIAIYKPQDVRPILEAYRGKDIPLEYAKKEAEAKQKHIEEWKSGKGKTAGGFTFSSLFGGPQVRPYCILLHVFDSRTPRAHSTLIRPSHRPTSSRSVVKRKCNTVRSRHTSPLTRRTSTNSSRKSRRRLRSKCPAPSTVPSAPSSTARLHHHNLASLVHPHLLLLRQVPLRSPPPAHRRLVTCSPTVTFVRAYDHHSDDNCENCA